MGPELRLLNLHFFNICRHHPTLKFKPHATDDERYVSGIDGVPLSVSIPSVAGQLLSGDRSTAVLEPDQTASCGEGFWGRYRLPISMVLPGVLAHFVWWCVMIKYDLWCLFVDKYSMSIVMVFGSLIAGGSLW